MSTNASERYLLGEMDAEERDLYEEHFFACPDCADEVKAGARFRTAVRGVLEEAAAPQAVPIRRSAGEKSDDGGSLRLGWRDLFWPIPLGAAASMAALAMLAGYQGLVVVPGMRDALGEARELQPAPSYFLTIARSDVPVLRVAPGQRVVVLTLSRSSEQSFPFYLCAVRVEAGPEVARAVVPGPPEGEELQLLLPTQGLAAGSYAVSVTGLASQAAGAAEGEPTAYRFELRREPGDAGSR